MVEIQCTSCLTRYRIEPSVLPAERPTFKCSRCGHVFSADPRRAKSSPPAGPSLKRPALAPRAKPDTAGSAAPATQPPSHRDEHNPLARSFAEHDDFKPGENLSFDFAEDFGPASEPVGITSVKRLPCPGALSTVISPPSARASRRLMVKPSPVPPNLRVVELSPCTNG